MLLPEDMRLKVADVTMDLSNSMGAIAKSAFPNAVIIRDCFHVIQRCGEGIEEIRLRLKREAIKEQKKEKAEFRKKLERLAKQREAYRKTHKRPKGKKRGRKTYAPFHTFHSVNSEQRGNQGGKPYQMQEANAQEPRQVDRRPGRASKVVV